MESILLNQNNHERNSISLKESPNYQTINFNHILRCTIMISFVTLLIYLNNFNAVKGLTLNSNQCYNDNGFNLTSGIYQFFVDNIKFRNAYLIIAALLIDILLISSLYFWIFQWNDSVLMIALLLFYGIRGTVVLVNFFFKIRIYSR